MFLAFCVQVTHRGCVFCIRRSTSRSSGLRNAVDVLRKCGNRACRLLPWQQKARGIMLHGAFKIGLFCDVSKNLS